MAADTLQPGATVAVVGEQTVQVGAFEPPVLAARAVGAGLKLKQRPLQG